MGPTRKGFRRLGDPLFLLGLDRRRELGDRHTAGGVVTTFADTLKDASTLALWWGGADLYTDVALTTPAVDGGPAHGWKDQVATRHMLQAGADSTAPTYRASVAAFGNKPALEFDGGDWLQATVASGMINRNVYTLYAVALTTDANVSRAVFSSGRSSSDTPYCLISSNETQATQIGYRHRDDASNPTANPKTSGGGQTWNNGAAKLVTVRRIAANNWSLRVNGAEVATSTNAPGTTTIDREAIGALVRTSTDSYFIGKIAMVMASSADDYATKEPLIASHYSITIP